MNTTALRALRSVADLPSVARFTLTRIDSDRSAVHARRAASYEFTSRPIETIEALALVISDTNALSGSTDGGANCLFASSASPMKLAGANIRRGAVSMNAGRDTQHEVTPNASVALVTLTALTPNWCVWSETVTHVLETKTLNCLKRSKSAVVRVDCPKSRIIAVWRCHVVDYDLLTTRKFSALFRSQSTPWIVEWREFEVMS